MALLRRTSTMQQGRPLAARPVRAAAAPRPRSVMVVKATSQSGLSRVSVAHERAAANGLAVPPSKACLRARAPRPCPAVAFGARAAPPPRQQQHAPCGPSTRSPTPEHTQQHTNTQKQFADSIGLPTEEGIFGFRPFAEVWTGRLAMFGFAAAIVGEFEGKGGALQQLGLEPSQGLLTGLLAALGLALVAGTASTAKRLASREMSARDVARYKNFLALGNAERESEAAARAMKKRGDFTALGDDAAAIAAARAAGAPVDAFLSTSEVAEGAAAAAEMKAGDASRLLTISPADEAAQAAAAAADMKVPKAAAAGPAVSLAAREDILAEAMFASEEAKYARGVEIANGRAAMLGFLVRSSASCVVCPTRWGLLCMFLFVLPPPPAPRPDVLTLLLTVVHTSMRPPLTKSTDRDPRRGRHWQGHPAAADHVGQDQRPPRRRQRLLSQKSCWLLMRSARAAQCGAGHTFCWPPARRLDRRRAALPDDRT